MMPSVNSMFLTHLVLMFNLGYNSLAHNRWPISQEIRLTNMNDSSGSTLQSERQKILSCHNQTLCIRPKIQLASKVRIYVQRRQSFSCCVRFYFFIREGLLLHPYVTIVDQSDMGTADYLIYFAGSTPWQVSEFSNTTNPSHMRDRLIILDERDDTALQHSPWKGGHGINTLWYFMYFKRSYVARKDGMLIEYPYLAATSVYPMTYSLAEAYASVDFKFERDIEVMCTLRWVTLDIQVCDWKTSFTQIVTLVLKQPIPLKLGCGL